MCSSDLLFGMFNKPLFAWSGGNVTVTQAIDDSDLVNMGPSRVNAYYREDTRKQPHNLYSNTTKLWEKALEGWGLPTQLFEYRTPDDTPAGIVANGVKIDFDSYDAEWTWNAMSGLYEWKRLPGQPPAVSPVGALGDIGTSLFGVIGLLAALRHRDATGEGQYVDVAMFDSMVSFADVVSNWWSMGERPEPGQGLKMILDGFEASNGWFIVQVGREHEFERFANLVGQPGWLSDPRFATREGWRQHIEVIRAAVRKWAASMTNVEACHALAAAGVAAGPVFSAAQVIDDPHLRARDMIVEIDRTDGVADPVVTPGNPVKMSAHHETEPTRPPWQGEHTHQVLADELGLSADELASLAEEGVIA